MDQALNSQKTPLRASYGMSFVSILMKNDRVIKGFYCIDNAWYARNFLPGWNISTDILLLRDDRKCKYIKCKYIFLCFLKEIQHKKGESWGSWSFIESMVTAIAKGRQLLCIYQWSYDFFALAHWFALRDHSGYGLSQWETTLHCNIVSHWLSPYPEWSLALEVHLVNVNS